MIYIVLNAVPILIATLAGLLFGAAYHALRRRGGAERVGIGFVVLAFVAEYWLAAILAGALLLAPPKADASVMAIGSAVVIWLGFVVPTLVVTLRYRGIAARTIALDGAHWLGVMVIEAVVLHAIGLTLPPA